MITTNDCFTQFVLPRELGKIIVLCDETIPEGVQRKFFAACEAWRDNEVALS